MAKAYVKGATYSVNLNTGSYGSPTWAPIKAIGNINVKTNPADVEIPERGMDTGHLHGEKDPAVTFDLYEDTGDSNVTTLIDALLSGAMKELAIARGAMASASIKYWRMESVLMGVDLSAGRDDPSTYAVEAKRHANSDYAMTAATTAP